MEESLEFREIDYLRSAGIVMLCTIAAVVIILVGGKWLYQRYEKNRANRS